MKTLANLKKRLEALPGVRIGKGHAARFAQFLAIAAPAKEKLSTVQNAIALAAPVLPSSDYQVARRSISSSARIARGLADKVGEDPAVISAAGTEASFVRLTDNSNDALKKALSGWQNELQAKIEKWELVADVVAKLGQETPSLKAPGGRLKSAIDMLRVAKSALPKNQKDASSVRDNLEQLTEAVSKLGLDTPFGRFLQDAASEQGAALSAAEDEAVAEQIKSLKLAKVFRVRLSS